MRDTLTLRTALILSIIFFSAGMTAKAQSIDTLQQDTSVLIIESSVSPALVFLDSVVIGRTPIRFPVEKGTTHQIRLYKPGFLPFECEIGPIQTDSFVVRARLVKFYGEVSVFTGNDSSTISIDGRGLSKGSVNSLRLTPGEHEVKVFNPSFGKEVSSSFEVQPLRHTLLESEYNVIYTPRLLTSLLVPGYAQLEDKSYLEGIGFGVAAVASLSYLTSETSLYTSAQSKYESALIAYDGANSEAAAVEARNVANLREQQYQTIKKRFGISLGVAAVIWVGNAIDVALNHLLTNRIKIISGPAGGIFIPTESGSYQVTLAVQIR